jgi:hypothetical protein
MARADGSHQPGEALKDAMECSRDIPGEVFRHAANVRRQRLDQNEEFAFKVDLGEGRIDGFGNRKPVDAFSLERTLGSAPAHEPLTRAVATNLLVLVDD